MPITWTVPATGDPFGPGFSILAESDFEGPIQAGSYWRATLREPEAGPTVQISTRSTVTGIASFVFGEAGDAIPLPAMYGDRVGGTTLELFLELVEPDEDVIDSGTVSVVYDPTSGAPHTLSTLLGDVTASQSDLTAQVAAVKAAVTITFPGSAVATAIASLVPNPGPALLVRSQITGDRGGAACMTRTVGPIGVLAYGIAWDVISYPAGVGLNEGAPDWFSLPFLQLETRHTDLNSDVYSSAWDTFRVTDSRWLWPQPFPTEVCYWILPGFTVRFYWLLLPGM